MKKGLLFRLISTILCLMIMIGCVNFGVLAEGIAPGNGFYISNKDAHTGVKSLLHTGDESLTTLFKDNVYAGTYVYCAYIKLSEGGKASLLANENEIAAVSTSGWQKVVGIIEMPNDGEINFQVKAQGDVAIDDVELRPLDIIYNDIILNGNFEEDQLGWNYGAFCYFELENPYGGSGNSLGFPGDATRITTQNVNVEQNTWYMYFADIKRDGAGSWTYIDLDPTWTNLDSSLKATKVGEWQHVAGLWYSGENTSASVRLVRDTCYDYPNAPFTDNSNSYFDNVGMCAVDIGSNLIDDDSNLLSKWTSNQGFELSSDVSANKYKSDSKSLKLTYTTADQGEAKAYANDGEFIEIEPYTDYMLSAWSYACGAPMSAKPSISIEAENGITLEDTTYDHDTFSQGGFNYWTHMSSIWNSGSNTKVKVYVSATPTQEGDAAVSPVYFDEMQLLSIKKANQSSNLIPGGTFEDAVQEEMAEITSSQITDSGAWKVTVNFSEPVKIKTTKIFNVSAEGFSHSDVIKVVPSGKIVEKNGSQFAESADIFFRMPKGIYEMPEGTVLRILGSASRQQIPSSSIETLSGNLIKAEKLLDNSYCVELILEDKTPDITEGEDVSAEIVDGVKYNFMNCDTGRHLGVSKNVDEYIAVKLEGNNRYAFKDASTGKYLDFSKGIASLSEEQYPIRIVKGSNKRYYIVSDDLKKSLIDTDEKYTAYASTAWTGGTNVIENNWYISASGSPRPMKIMLLGDSITDGDSVMNGVAYIGNDRTGYRTILSEKLNELGDRYVYVGSKKYSQTYETDSILHRHEGHSGWLAYDIYHNPSHPGLNEYIDDWMTKYTPDTVLVQIGTNDCGIISHSSDIEGNIPGIMERWKLFIEQLWGLMDEDTGTLVISNLTPIHPKMGSVYFKTYIERFNEEMPAFVEKLENEGVNIVRAYNYEALNELDGGYLTGISEDLIHPNTKGYSAMAESYFSAVTGHWSDLEMIAKRNSITIIGDNNVSVGDSIKLTAETTPENAQIEWSSSDTSIATVDSEGNVKGVKTGEVTIIARMKNVHSLYAEKMITVDGTDIENISVTGEQYVVLGDNVQYEALVMPADAAQEVKWKVYAVEGSGTITEDGMFTATKVGVVVIEAISKVNPEIYAYIPLMVIEEDAGDDDEPQPTDPIDDDEPQPTDPIDDDEPQPTDPIDDDEPVKPADPTDDASANGSEADSSNAPETSDSNALALWVLLVALGAAGIAVVFKQKEKNIK